MHITILAMGSRGDILPYAVLGQGLGAAGHHVRFITFENFAPLVAQHGLDFHPVEGDAQALVSGAGANAFALFRAFGSLGDAYVRAFSAPILRETDLILNQLPVGLFGFDLAEAFKVPLVLAAVIPLARTRAFPLMGAPRLPLPGYNRVTHLLGEQIAWQMFRATINRWRRQVLGLAPQPLTGYFNQLGTERVPILNGFSSHVVPRPDDWGEHIHLTGYWFPEDRAWQPPADLQAFLEAGEPPVFIGFGSMPVRNPQKTTRILLEALKASGRRGILHAGWGGLGTQVLPDDVFMIDYAPYSWLFPRMAMVIHHGGSGTTAAALRAGVPSCVVPLLFDQFYWGARTAELGVGPAPVNFRQLSVERLREAIEQGTGDARLRQRARELGGQIRAEDGIENATRLIEEILRAK